MPRTLIVMRHAKQSALAASDHDRPLTDEGRDAAHHVGRNLLRDGLDVLPDLDNVGTVTTAQNDGMQWSEFEQMPGCHGADVGGSVYSVTKVNRADATFFEEDLALTKTERRYCVYDLADVERHIEEQGVLLLAELPGPASEARARLEAEGRSGADLDAATVDALVVYVRESGTSLARACKEKLRALCLKNSLPQSTGRRAWA